MGWMPNNSYKKNRDNDGEFKYFKKKKKALRVGILGVNLAVKVKSMVDVNKKPEKL